jgi:hypothetical protein
MHLQLHVQHNLLSAAAAAAKCAADVVGSSSVCCHHSRLDCRAHPIVQPSGVQLLPAAAAHECHSVALLAAITTAAADAGSAAHECWHDKALKE